MFRMLKEKLHFIGQLGVIGKKVFGCFWAKTHKLKFKMSTGTPHWLVQLRMVGKKGFDYFWPQSKKESVDV